MKLFLHKYLAHHMYKPILIGEELKKTKNSVFWALKCSYFVLSVLWTGNKLEADDVENCENS